MITIIRQCDSDYDYVTLGAMINYMKIFELRKHTLTKYKQT